MGNLFVSTIARINGGERARGEEPCIYRILIVEDDVVIAGALQKELSKWGYEVACVKAFDRVLQEFEQFLPDLVLLDLSLPFYSGYYWCQEIRRQSRVPILFLSSTGEDMNIVLAIQMGGDDFISKPFHLEVVVAKVQAALRRAYDFGGPSQTLRVGEVVLDLQEATLSYRDEKCRLTKNEFILLRVLMEHKNAPVSREEIMRRLWEDESFIDDNTLTVNVARLRKKLEEMGLFAFIKTQKGLGYVVEEGYA